MRFLITIFSLLSILKINAQQAIEFIENKGQWNNNVSFVGNIGADRFAIKKDGGYRLQLNHPKDVEEIAAYYHGHKHHNETQPKTSTPQKDLILRSHVYEVSFLNANPNPEIKAEKLVAGMVNYLYGNDPSKWGTDCKVYQAVTAKNIYPNIDVRYYTGEKALKYDIIVNPGANANKIALYIDGADKLKSKEGKLIIETSVNTITEPKPYTYQAKAVGRKQIECEFVVKGNIVTFNLGNYDNAETLVIDPTLVFSTLTGSTADNWGYTATYDDGGSLYAGGIVFVATGISFPVSNGAFQTNYGGGENFEGLGGYDVALIKYNSTGTQRVYATYLGGNSNEQPHSLVVDANGNLAIAGRTRSANFPTTSGRFGPTGGWDIFVTKLNANGNGLIGSLIVGGSEDDGVNVKTKNNGMPDVNSISRNYGDDARSEIIVDALGNLLIASCTQSTNFFTTAAFQNFNASAFNPIRKQDAVFLRVNATVSTILVSSYLGGTNDEAAFVLALNPSNNNIFLAGGTTSNDFPGNKSTAYQASFQGGVCDGFVAELSSDGTNLIRSSYFGTRGAENIYGIQFDRFGFPYIMGTTTGAWPVQNAAFSQINGKQFIAKLQPNLSGLVYSTVFGTNNPSPNLSPSAFLVDRCENVYVSGWGGVVNQGYPNAGTAGLTVTSDALKSTTDGSDVYFFVLEKNATRQLYGSFFGQNGLGPANIGGEHVDGGTSRFDRNGVIYQTLCANCGSAGINFPTFPSNVWSANNGATGNGGGCNMASFKIAFNLAGIGSEIQSSIRGVIKDTSGCVPLTVSFFDSLKQGTRYIWNFADGTGDFTTFTPALDHIFTAIGTYRVRLVSIDSSSCNIADTSYLTMRVREDIATLNFTASKVGGCESTTFQFTNTSIPPPGKPFQNNSFRIDFGDGRSANIGSGSVNHTYAAFGTYNARLVLIDTNYCNEPDTMPLTLRIIDNVDARFITPSSGCVPYSPVFQNTSLGGLTFTWHDGQGNVQTGTTPNFTYNTVGTYTVKMYAFDAATCNKLDSAITTITVNPAPTALFSMSPNPSTINATTSFTNNSVGAIRYKWIFEPEDSLVTTQISPPVRYTYLLKDTYNPCLIAFNNFGCSDTLCQPIDIEVSPLFDVPNSFTPNGDGINDVFYVRAFGAISMNWTIYNRFGKAIFNSTSVKKGWNGTFNGVLQPQEVYNYTLVLKFADGTTKTRTGDITLLK